MKLESVIKKYFRWASASFAVAAVFFSGELQAGWSREPRPGYDGVVDCITRPDGVKQCQPGEYIVPGHRPPPYRPPVNYPRPHRPVDPVYPVEPNYPEYPDYPQNPHYPPHHDHEEFDNNHVPYFPDAYAPGLSDLRGYCAEGEHQQFYTAKNFAYSTSGLNLSSQQAVDWALAYNRSFRCNTISDFSNRFYTAKNFAYSTSGLNLSSIDAIKVALNILEKIPQHRLQEQIQAAQSVKNFAYSTSGLNSSSLVSSQIAQHWLLRGYCGDASRVNHIWSEYRRHFNFAYSSSGLNRSSFASKQYAIDKIYHLTQCSDLFRK